MALGSNLNGLNFSYSFLAQKRRLEWQRFAVESIGFQGTSDDACQFCLWDCEIKPAVDINFNFKCDKKKKKRLKTDLGIMGPGPITETHSSPTSQGSSEDS